MTTVSPVASAGAHRVVYTVWIERATSPAMITYIANEPPSQEALTNDPAAYHEGGYFNLEPGEHWTAEASMDNPTQWAQISIGSNGLAPSLRSHCEIRVDGAVRTTGGTRCELRWWGPPRGPGTL